MNYCIVCGRIKEIRNKEIVISIPRLDEDITDDLLIKMNEHLFENVKEHCSLNDYVGIKGTIRNEDCMFVLAEKLTLLQKEV